MKKILLVILYPFCFSSAFSQNLKTDSLNTHKDSLTKTADTITAKTDTLNDHSPIKTLTAKQYDAYKKGIDINDLSFVATINHFPLPEQVLKYKKALDLSPIQVKQINEIIATQRRKLAQDGESILLNEKTLDSLFSTKKLNEGLIIYYANRYGLYAGEYRTIVLLACYKTRNVLTDRQLDRFYHLRSHK